MPRIVAAVVILLILAAVMTASFQVSLESGGEQETIVNESFSPASAGNVSALDESDRDDVFYVRERKVTVYNDTDHEMVEGQDYIWLRSNGTIETLSGGGLDGAPSATATYGYSKPTDAQLAFTGALGQLPSLLGLAAPMFVLIIFLRLIG